MKWQRVPLKATAGSTGLITDGDWITARNMDPSGNIRLIQLADIGIGRFLNRSSKFINEEKFAQLDCTQLESNDVLISRMADPIGRACLVPNLSQRAITAVDVTILRTDRSVADPRFIMFLCNTSEFRSAVESAATGTTRSRITRRNLERIQIPLPPPSEQRRIVKILDQADHLRRLRAEADAKADRILPALFLKMFGDPPTNPMSWPDAPLARLLSPVDKRDPSVEPDESFIYIDIAGVDGTSGEIVDTKVLLGAQAPSRARQIVREGDVLVSTVRPYLRATARVPRELDGQICSTGFSVLRAKRKIGRGYLYALSRTHWFTEQLMARARGASYPAVTNKDIWQMQVPLPNDRVELGRCNYAVDAILENRSYRKIAKNRIDALFNSLLQLVFSASLTESRNEARTAQLQREFKRQASWNESSPLSQRKRGGKLDK